MKLNQTLRLQHKLTPKLIQSLHLLQLPTFELEQLIRQEIEINPLLEIDEIPELELSQEKPEEDDLVLETKELEREEDLEQIDWNIYLRDGYEGDDEIREEFDFNTESKERGWAEETSMTDNLRSQLGLAVSDEKDLQMGENIIGNLNDDGYLTCSVEEIASNLKTPVEEVQKVLSIVQSFEPSGIAARDLQECLVIQLRDSGLENSLAMRIITDYWEDFKKKRFKEISKELKVSEEEISEAMEVIAGLNPKPGISISNSDIDARVVVPDLTVDKVDDNYVVILNDTFIPALRISPLYRSIIINPQNVTEEARKYVLEKLNSARWLIKSVHQRQSTMLKVMNCIVQEQKEFFDKGIAFLKPMVLQDVADAIGMHVSTVSRVTNGKYAQTPHGIFELKFFFSGKINSVHGDDVSSQSVIDKIQQLVENEDPRNPLSDQKMVELLKEEGIKIARRTVAKYRDDARINSARYRKKL